MSNQKAVVFDMDGVLMDSFTPHFESWRAMFAEYGYDITLENFALTFGKTSRETIPILVPGLPDEQIREMDQRKEFLYREIVARKFPAMPGIFDLLARLRTWNYAIAIGSSGPQDNVEQAVRKLDPESRYFDAIANGSDVKRGKPAPDVFLLALERLQTKFPKIVAADCVVVEDSPLGVAAARAAGMHAIGFASTGRTRDELADADYVVNSLDEITLTLLQTL
ncbi:MAG: HAD family phosphatase [Thermoguttaceae bacterium]|nr:HAD family phosphatase [Thermoguttaceae bacterium]